MLEQAGIVFTVHRYDYDPDADHVGVQAAEALGEPPQRCSRRSWLSSTQSPSASSSRQIAKLR
jgi:hypothetical protein